VKHLIEYLLSFPNRKIILLKPQIGRLSKKKNLQFFPTNNPKKSHILKSKLLVTNFKYHLFLKSEQNWQKSDKV
jgi:hypothetical protein